VRRPGIKTEEIMKLNNEKIDQELASRCDIEVKYEGYIQKARREAAKLENMENMKLGIDFNYDEVDNLSIEGRQKLMKYRPETMGQASRISGVNPADLAVLAVAIRQMKGRQL
jgi:tRNA uridine 5-carboxymethylaminomethyl modification enzyme